jgi:serine phosphatase RsbU (regulator of sigma subunit)
VLVLLFVALLILIAYFLTHSYYVQLDLHKNKVLDRLEAIANTAALQLDGDQLQHLLTTYQKKDAIESNLQDVGYASLQKELLNIKEQNHLRSDLYTLTFDSENNAFFFGVSSSQQPYFRHLYDEFPTALEQHYFEGGKIDVYEDENGYWLSAFAPIKNSKGKVVGVVQADSLFDEFLYEARSEIFMNIVISLVVTLVLMFFLVRSMHAILHTEDVLTANLIQSKLALEQKNQDMLDSIQYAKKIQDAILPQQAMIAEVLPESFIFFEPRDIVSGDFYWFKKCKGKIYVAAVDCTGHGVPGAFMSMIGATLLDDIISKKELDKPNEILNHLNSGIVKALKQNGNESTPSDGMDIALCVIDVNSKVLQFAGAFRPLLWMRKGRCQRLKSDAYSIGGHFTQHSNHQLQEIRYEEGDAFYIYSDGYADQFGGEKGKKFMTKRFRELIVSIEPYKMSRQKELLREAFISWKGEEEQVDDVLVIGFRL